MHHITFLPFMKQSRNPLARSSALLVLPIMIALGLILAGCSGAEDKSTVTYMSPATGYSVQIPAKWEGNYEVIESEAEEGVKISSYDYIGDNDVKNFMFRIVAYPTPVWMRISGTGDPVLNTQPFARTNDYVFAMVRSLDNPYTGNDQTEYGNMTQKVNDVMDSFRLEGSEPYRMIGHVVYFGNSVMNPNADCNLVYPVNRDTASAADKAFSVLEQLFEGPTEQETAAGYTSFFSEETADAVKTLKIEGETAYINLEDIRGIIPNANSSCGSAQFLAEIKSTLMQFPQIKRVIIAIDGNTETFYEWIQLGCSEENNNCDNTPFTESQ
jgi:hypothetical protein